MNNESAKSLSYAHDLLPNYHNLTSSEDVLEGQAVHIVEQIIKVCHNAFPQLYCLAL